MPPLQYFINESKNTSDLIKEIKLRRNTMDIEDESRCHESVMFEKHFVKDTTLSLSKQPHSFCVKLFACIAQSIKIFKFILF